MSRPVPSSFNIPVNEAQKAQLAVVSSAVNELLRERIGSLVKYKRVTHSQVARAIIISGLRKHSESLEDIEELLNHIKL